MVALLDARAVVGGAYLVLALAGLLIVRSRR